MSLYLLSVPLSLTLFLFCSLKLVTARNLSNFDSSLVRTALFKPINLRPTFHSGDENDFDRRIDEETLSLPSSVAFANRGEESPVHAGNRNGNGAVRFAVIGRKVMTLHAKVQRVGD